MPDQLTPDQIHQLLQASAEPERQGQLKDRLAMARALRSQPQAGPQNYHSLAAGLLGGMSGLPGNIRSAQLEQQMVPQQEQLIGQKVGAAGALAPDGGAAPMQDIAGPNIQQPIPAPDGGGMFPGAGAGGFGALFGGQQRGKSPLAGIIGAGGSPLFGLG